MESKRKKRVKRGKLSLNMSSLISKLGHDFGEVKDGRAKNVVYKLKDVLLSGFAMFSLKYSSLLEFDQQTSTERSNLKSLYGVSKVCSDSQFRTILDQVKPSSIYSSMPKLVKELQAQGGLRDYQILGDYLIVSIDGVEYFRSCSIGCKRCLKKKHRNGKISNSHAMLGCSLVHPSKREVFPVGAEFIEQQDGCKKNDCELNASKRLKAQLKVDYPEEKLLIVEDALYATGPNIEQILGNEWTYVIAAKPGSNETLFRHFEGRKSRNQLKTYEFKDEKGTKHRFYWMNNVPLNESSNVRTNFLYYEEEDKKGRVQVFSWVTSFTIRQRNVVTIMRVGRSRWKIENETFNTLKNQGYHFEHNYGHGYQHLCNVLALLMLLAFLVDQIIQAADKLFQVIEKKIRTKKRLWQDIQALFRTTILESFQDLYRKVASLHQIQLE